ncbi:MAG: hypothetical protein ACREUT_08810, partial [Steroidobacteraceae bacterium]
ASPAPEQPKSITVETALSKVINAERLSQIERHAATLALIRVIEEARDTKRENVDAILAGAFSTISAIVLFGLYQSGWDIQLNLLQEWFTHRGDYVAMKGCLTARAECKQSRPGQLLELIDKHLAQAREEYARVFVNGQRGE